MFDKIMSMARDLYFLLHLIYCCHDTSSFIINRTEKIPIGKTELEKTLFEATSSENYMSGHDEIYSIIERTFH